MSERNCTMLDCNGPHHARGMCNKHYHEAGHGFRPRACVVSGCDGVTDRKSARGLCVMHYGRLVRTGSLEAGAYYKPWLSAAEVLWERSEPHSECVLWTGGLSKDGYGSVSGSIWLGYYRPHRFSWFIANGPIPEELELDHTCHTGDAQCDPTTCLHRRCINPDHLEVVTHGENTRRRSARVSA